MPENPKFDVREVKEFLEFLAFDCTANGNPCDRRCPKHKICTTIPEGTIRRIAKDTLKLIAYLKERLVERDNLLIELGVNFPNEGPMYWHYTTLEYPRKMTVDGELICPKCGTHHYRIAGTRVKHCPECGRRMRGC